MACPTRSSRTRRCYPGGSFTTALNTASRSLTANQNMITKIYFPRLVLPLASVLGGVVDFAIAFVILIVLMIYYRVTPTVAVWTLPLFLLLALITALGVALWLSAINVQYRDVNYVLPFLTQFWLFLTPVAYSAKVIFREMAARLLAEPDGRCSERFRWALLGTNTGPNLNMAVSVLHIPGRARQRTVLLPLDGKDLRGHDLR